MNPTATLKERFLHSETNRQQAKDYLSNPDVRNLFDVAMAEFVRQETVKLKDPEIGPRIQGAHLFLNVLLGLANPIASRTRSITENLPQPD